MCTVKTQEGIAVDLHEIVAVNHQGTVLFRGGFTMSFPPETIKKIVNYFPDLPSPEASPETKA